MKIKTKKYAINVIKNKGWCIRTMLKIQCKGCRLDIATCDPMEFYRKAIQWMIDNDHKEELLELLI